MKKIAMVVLLAFVACKKNSSNSQTQSTRNAQTIINEIKDMSGLSYEAKDKSGLSCSLPPDCRVEALGKNSCGKPIAYVVVSAIDVDEKRLDKLKNELDQLPAQGECVEIEKPTTDCFNKNCRITYPKASSGQ